MSETKTCHYVLANGTRVTLPAAPILNAGLAIPGPVTRPDGSEVFVKWDESELTPAPVETGPDEDVLAQAFCLSECAERSFKACTWEGGGCLDRGDDRFSRMAELARDMWVKSEGSRV